ncbi:fibroblast growth factor receptor 1-A [Hydra vulgaris]|uniref:Fibroblast growth factor receptor n=1 Tax=Hydra vulgaris TaxID=6087 RepID=A0ABM4BLT0_HYDVU
MVMLSFSWFRFVLALITFKFTILTQALNTSLVVTDGNLVSLTCSSNISTTKVIWLKDGLPINTKSQKKIYNLRKDGYLLKFKANSEAETGIYTCADFSNNRIGRNLISFNVTLRDSVISPKEGKLQFTDKARMNNQRHTVSPAGDEVTFHCAAEGANPIVYKWKMNGKILLSRRVDSSLEADKPTLLLKDIVKSDSGNYTCIAENLYGSIEYNFTLQVQERLRVGPYLEKGLQNQTVFVGSNTTIDCYELISGTIPDFRFLKWKVKPDMNLLNEMISDSTFKKKFVELLDPGSYDSVSKKTSRMNEQNNLYGVQLRLQNVSVNDSGYYTCLVSNHIGSDYVTMYLDVRSNTDHMQLQKKTNIVSTSKNKKMVIAVVVLSVLCCIALIVFVYMYWNWKKKISSKVSNENVFLNEVKLNIDKNRPIRLRNFSSGGSDSTFPLLNNGSIRNGGSVRSNSESKAMYPGDLDDVFEIPFDPEWEVDRDCLHITETLGEGAFGVVVKADAVGLKKCEENHTTVAVKMLKADATENELLDLLSEMETMKQIGRHINIINFLGCCTQSDPVYVIVEYAPNGNLRQFLRSKRPPMSDNGYRSDPLLSVKDIVSFALQIAKGMEYLASKKCIHRDLAARNILVTEDYIMKIADFGLARSVHEIDYYRKTTDGRLPVKWLAIEALFDRVYTTQSDVWAFGVLLWEIFTLGGSPYPGIPVERLFDLLKSGFRMEKPQVCPQETYEIMVKCWYENPSHRPSFSDLVLECEEFLEELTNLDYLEVLNQSTDSLNSLPSEKMESDESYNSSVVDCNFRNPLV